MTYNNKIPMQSWCEDDKPSTKILLKGKIAMSDAELLSIIIGNDNSPKRSCLETARLLIHHANDNLSEIARSSASELVTNGNITLAQATRIITAFELGRRRGASDVASKKRISSSKYAFDLLQPLLSDKPYEEFWIILLNRANKILGQKMISEGGMSGTVVDPKKIFKMALEHHACGIILGHNHPSGNIQPSESDRRITQKLLDAGKLLEIAVLDHIILADNQYYSFSDEGAI